jgi:hypothetical protein
MKNVIKGRGFQPQAIVAQNDAQNLAERVN